MVERVEDSQLSSNMSFNYVSDRSVKILFLTIFRRSLECRLETRLTPYDPKTVKKVLIRRPLSLSVLSLDKHTTFTKSHTDLRRRGRPVHGHPTSELSHRLDLYVEESNPNERGPIFKTRTDPYSERGPIFKTWTDSGDFG